jgi:metal-responsive CopG/Arc/MetJ family transcriptional regulator
MLKSDDTTEFVLRMPKSLAAALEDMAKQQYSSRSAVLRRLIAAAAAKKAGEAVTNG